MKINTDKGGDILLTEKEVEKRVKEAKGDPVEVISATTGKTYLIELDSENQSKPYFLCKGIIHVRSAPTERYKRGRVIAMKLENLAFI